MTWTQNYNPLGNVFLSTLIAALPVVILLGSIALLRIRIHFAAALGVTVALLVALFSYRMPPSVAAAATAYGAAFGLFADSPSEWKIAVLVLFSIVALVIVSALLWRNSHHISTTGVGLALILGGALGNLWDRLVSGRVVDFLLFYLGQYQWPAFNVADSAICTGVGLVFLITWRSDHQAKATAPQSEPSVK